MRSYQKIIVFFLLLTLSACGMIGNDHGLWMRPATMPPLPHGSPEFTQGWQDGCQSGMAAYGSDVYKAIYKWKRDEELAQNSPKYYHAWKDSYNYCRHFLQTWSKSVFAPEGLTPLDNDLAAPQNNPFAPDQGIADFPSMDKALQQDDGANNFFGSGIGNFFGY